MKKDKVFPKPAVDGMDAIAEHTWMYLLRGGMGYLILIHT
jgi:hypothetical protein